MSFFSKSCPHLRRTVSILLLVIPVFAAPALAVAPAFDCDKAEGEVELLICSDDDLAVLDLRLAKTYSQASQNIPAEERDNFRALQRGWIKGRNDCWKAEDVRDCVEFSYRSRSVELQIAGGLLDAPRYRSLQCGEDAAALPFTVSIYRNSDPESAVLTRGNDQVTAIAPKGAPAGRYEAPNVSLTVADGRAAVEWYGETLECSLQ